MSLERFEDRNMLAAGPELISIIPDNGGLLVPGETLNVAPHQLTFRFDQDQVIDPSTLNGIELTRSGGDGVFGNGNDVRIFPGFIGIGSQTNEVVMRFSSPLPDDLYQITIIGAGPNALTNQVTTGGGGSGGLGGGQGEGTSQGALPFNGGVNYSQDFRLNLGPQVLSVVPQPISPALPDPNNPGKLLPRTEASNEIDVYFNEALDPTSASNPALYQLIRTKNTSTTADDTVVTPTEAIYVSSYNEVRLIFGQYNSLGDFTAPNSLDPNSPNLDQMPNEALRLRIGNTDQPQQSPLVVQVPGDPNNPATPVGSGGPGDTFGASMNTGTLGSGATEIFNSSIAPLPVNPGLLFPGSDAGPGQQDLPQPITAGDLRLPSGALTSLASWVEAEGIQNHILDGKFISPGGVITIPYNFQDIYGTDVKGNLLHNAITPAQKQTVRDIFGLYAYYTGVSFVETAHDGITVATGDIRAVSPEDPPTAVNGVEGPTSTSNGGPVAIINGNVNWGQSAYGGLFFRVAMHEIGHALGLGNNYDQPGSIMGPDGYEDPTQPPPDLASAPSTPINPDAPASSSEAFPSAPDVGHLQFLYRTDSTDVQLYKFTVTQSGSLNAETLAQRLTPTSSLNTVLSLYNEVTLLGVPATGGQAVSDGQTFTITSTTPDGTQATRTYEFNSGISLNLTSLPADGSTFTLQEGTGSAVTFEFDDNGSFDTNNVPIEFGVNDSIDTVSAAVAQAINTAVKNASGGLSAANPAISATYTGHGVINIGGDANTKFTAQDSGLTASGSATLPSGDNNILVRYAPADTQHDLSLAIANAINDPVLDVKAGANQVAGEQFQVSDGITTKTYEVTEGTAPPAGVIPILIGSSDSATTIAAKIASVLNDPTNGFGSGAAIAEGNHVALTLHGGSASTVGTAPNLAVITFNVSATPELNQVQLQGPLTLTIPPTSAEFTSSIQRNLVSRNDDYFGHDSYIGLELEPGVYYVGVSSAGNTQFDPNVHNSGWGGNTDGLYELRLNFRADAATQNSLVSFVNTPGVGLNALGQDTPQPLDGDADGAPGGAYNFWFNVGPTTFADKLGDSVVPSKVTVSGGQTTFTSLLPAQSSIPSYTTIQAALNSNLQPGADLRIEGNGGASLAVPVAPTLATAIAGGQTFSINAGPTTTTFEFFQLGGDALEVNTGGSNALDGQTFTISQGNATVTFEFALNGRTLATGDKNTPVAFRATDTKQQLANDVAGAINGAKSLGLFGASSLSASVGTQAAPDGNWVVMLGGDANTSYANLPTAATATSTSPLVLRRGGSGAPFLLTNNALEVVAANGNAVTNGSSFSIKQGNTTVSFEFSKGRLTLAAGDTNVPVPYNLNGVNDSPAVLAGEIAQAINAAVMAGLFGGSPPIAAAYNSADDANGRPVVTVGGDQNTTLAVSNNAAGAMSVLAAGATLSPVAVGGEIITFSPTDAAAALAAKIAPAINASPLGQIPLGAAGPQPVTASVNAFTNPTVVQLVQGPFRLTINPATTPLVPTYSDVPYQIGTNTDFSSPSGPPPLADGTTFNVPKGVTAIIDPGAEFKMLNSIIDVGSSSANIDRSQAALQVLGVPGDQAIFTSFNDNTVGGTLESPVTAPAKGNWGGLVFRNDSDLEPLGIFLNYVDEATFRYGGGSVTTVTGQPQQYDTITMQTARPTISNNILVDNASAPISANPNSFEETHFGQDVTLLAGAPGDTTSTTAASQIVDGQTFQIHGTTFEFDNLNSPATIGVLPGDVAIGYYGIPSGITNPHAVDTNAQLAGDIAAAINGASLTAPFVQAAVTGNQVTITNVALDSSVALQVSFSVAISPNATGATISATSNTIAVTYNGATKVFEFTTTGLPPGDTNVPIVVAPGDSAATLAGKAAQTIDGAAGFNKPGLATAAANSINFIPGVAASASGAQVSGFQAGQTFSVKGTVFQFFNGDVLQVTAPQQSAGSGTGIVDGDSFTIDRGGHTLTFEFALDNRQVTDGNWPINFTQTDTDEALGRAVTAAINAAAAAGAFSGAPVAYQGMPTDGQTFTITRGTTSQTFEFVSDARTQPATDTNWPVSYASGVFLVDISASATGATIGGGGNTITVTFGGATKTFEFTTSTLPAGDTNVPIVVAAGDSAATLATKAAQTIDGPQGFNNATVAGANGGNSTITFVSGAVASAAGAEVAARTSVSPETIEQDITLAISAAVSAGRLAPTAEIVASYSGFDPSQPPGSPQHTLVSLSDDASTTVSTNSANTGALAFAKSTAGPMRLTAGDVAVYFQPGYSAAQLAGAVAAAVNGAQIDGGAGAVIYAESVTDANGNARVDLMNTSNVDVTAPNHAPLSLSLLTPLSINALPGSQLADGDGFTVNGRLFEFDQGTTLGVQRPGGVVTPVSLFGSTIVGGHSFTINDGTQSKQFIFYVDTPVPTLQPNQVGIEISSFWDPNQVAAAIASAVNNTVASGGLTNVRAYIAGDGGPDSSLLGLGQVRIVGTGTVVPVVDSSQATELTNTAALHGGISVPFAPGYTASQIAQGIGAAVSAAGIGVSANSNGASVVFENADSVVPHPPASLYLNANGNVPPTFTSPGAVFTMGGDVLPLGLENNFYTADYARLGPDVHGNLLAVREPQTITVTNAAQVQDGQQFVISGVGFEFDTGNGVTAGFHPVTFQTGQTADQIAQDIVKAINAASDPTNAAAFVPGFNVHAQAGPAGSGEVILLLNAPASFNLNNFNTQPPAGSLSLGTTELTLPLNTVPVRILGQTPLSQQQKVIENTLNGLLVRINTNAGQSLDTLDVTARFHATDISYIIPENLVLTGQPGGPSGTVGRESARLQIDPGVIVKLHSARIEVGLGADLVAEGDQNHLVTFTSLFDDTVGSGGTFFANGDDLGTPTPAAPGDWGGLFFSPTSQGSLDYVSLAYGGGSVPIEGTTASFNAVEIHQAKVRITNSTLANNAAGVDPVPTGRNGRGVNTGAVIYVLGAQPVLADNIIENNSGSAISVDVNSLTSDLVPDWGRSTGPLDALTNVGSNYGPLVRGNKIGNTAINGMVVRGGTLTTDSIWDDTDIVHVVQDEIKALNSTTIRLQSTATQSLVVKLQGASAGLTASGAPSDIQGRIGGTVQVLGQPGHPVVMTALTNCDVGAGLTPQDQPQNDTDNGNCGVALTAGSGAVFVDGGDRDDFGHGDFDPNTGKNVGGWLLIQEAMNFVYSGSRNAAGTGVLVIGAQPGGRSADAVTSAAKALGISLTFVTGAQISTVNFNLYRALYVPSDEEDTDGGISDSDLLLLDGRKSDIQNYVNNSGGSLMALTEANSPTPYNWLQLPAPLTIQTYTAAGNIDPLKQTPALAAAGFNITDADINLGIPWHNSFTGPPGFNNMVPFIVDAVTGEVVTLGLAPGSTGIGGTGAAPGSWNTIKFDEYANDRNVSVTNEVEAAYTGGNDTNGTPQTAEPLGSLAPNQQSGDDNLRLGFQVNGYISPNDTHDVDTYSFTARPGTQAWLDVGHTSPALDAVLELVDANGNVLARSDNSVLEQEDAIKNGNPLAPGPLLSGLLPGNLALPMQSDTFQQNTYPGQDLRDIGSTNEKDPGMRVVLPGTPNPDGTPTTYYVRIYSKGPINGDGTPGALTYSVVGGKSNGLSSGAYQLQVRLQEQWETPGSVVRFGDISFAANGITVLGQPAHSPLSGDSASNGANSVTIPVASGAPNTNQAQYDPGVQPNNFQNAQDLGNLATSDSGSVSVAGNLNAPGQVDWYKFALNFNLMQAIQGVNAGDKTLSTIFHIGYADGLGRPDTTISVYDQWGHLIFVGRDSNVADEQPRPTQGNDETNLSHGSFGTNDPYIGPVQLPAGVPGGTVPTTGGRVSPSSATYPLDPSTYPMPLQTINNYDGPNSYTYFVAVSSNATLPTALDATFNAGSSNPLVRLEPIDGIQRMVEDHTQGFTLAGNKVSFGQTGYNSNDTTSPLGNGTNLDPQDGPILPISTGTDLLNHVVPWNLNNVVLYASTNTNLYAINPANGAIEPHNGNPYITQGLPNPTEDLAFRADGNLFGYYTDTTTDNDSGHLIQIDTTTGAFNDIGGDTGEGLTPPTTRPVDALAYTRLGVDSYKLFYSAPDQADPRVSDLLYANMATGAVSPLPPYFNVGSMLTGPKARPVSGAQISPGDNFSITDFANRTIEFVLEPSFAGTTFVPNSPPGDAGTYFISYTPTDSSLTVGQEVSSAINTAFRFDIPPPSPRPAGFSETSATFDLFTGAVAVTDAANIDGTNAPEFSFTNAPGGLVTGMAFDPNTGLFYAVSSNGGVYVMTVNNGIPNPRSITYLGSSSVFTQRGYHFEGLSIGPQNVDWNGDGTPGDLKDVLFAVADAPGGGSILTAITDTALGANNIFSPNAIGAGGPVAVFDQGVPSGSSTIETGDYVDNVSLGNLTGVKGIAMSPLDFNMWHPSDDGRPGHGVTDPAPDNSRVGNTNIGSTNSFYFGLDKPMLPPSTYSSVEAPSPTVEDLVKGTTNSLDNSVPNTKTFNAPGDVYGSLVTSPFSLAGYSAGDKPTVYFDYYLDTGMTNNSSANWIASARVFISPDGGRSWDEIATNNPSQTRYFPANDPGGSSLGLRQYTLEQVPGTSELPDFATVNSNVPASQTLIDPRQQVQQLFDNTGTWRQARIDLSNYSGDPNLLLRFDFSGTHGYGQFTAIKNEKSSGNPIPGETGSTDLGGDPGDAPHEGWYVGDLIVGLAGRGEMVTNTPAGQTQFFTTPQNPFFGNSPQILTGAYQLDVQKGTETGQSINPNRSNTLVDPNQLDINDRLTSAYTLIAPEGHFNQSLTQVPGATDLGPTSTVLPTYTYTFTNVPAATAGGTLTLSAAGDLEGSFEYLTASFPDLPANDPLNQAKIPVFFNQQDKGLQGQFFTTSQISFTQAQLLQLLAAGVAKHNANVITITLTPLPNASPTVTPGNPPNLSGSVPAPGPSLVNNLNMLAATLDFGIAGSFDGQTFTISDGVHQRVFELDDNNQLNNPTNIRVSILPSYTGAQIAQAMVAAINQAGLLNVQAATSDANNNNTLPAATPNDTSDRVNLFGAASVVVGAPPQVVSGPDPANSASAPVAPHGSIATAFATGVDSGTDPNLKPITSAGAGGLSSGTTYYYVVSATDTSGVNSVSNEQSFTASNGNGSASLYWAPQPGAVEYNIYRGTAPGQENVLVKTIGGGTTAYTGPTTFTDTGLAGSSAAPPPVTRVFNGYGVIGNAAGVGTSPQVDMMKVNLHAGDSMTITLDTKSILSTLDPTLRLFDANGMEVTSFLQDAAQAPNFEQQFNPVTGANYYQSPPTGQPGTHDDLYYTFTAPSTVSAPTLNTITRSAGGSLANGGTYYYVVTALAGGGETTASNEQSITTNAANRTADLSWSQVFNATGYKIYRGTSPGQENQLVAVIGNGRTTSFADNGSLTSASPPTTNTAGLNPPGLQTVTPQPLGSLPPGTYDYVVTAVNAQGETLASNELSGTAATPDFEMQLTWTPVSGATGYHIYRGTASGQENSLIASLPASATQFIDNGTETDIAGSPPAASTAQANGNYYVAVSGQGNDTYDPNGDGRERGSTGYYQIQISAGPIALRGASEAVGGLGNLTFNSQGDPTTGEISLPSNQDVPPDNNVNIGTLFYRAPDLNNYLTAFGGLATGTNDTTIRVVKYDNLTGDTQTPRPQGSIILESNQVSNALNDGILISSSPREGLQGSANSSLPHQGAVRNLPVLDTARLVPGAVVKNNIVSGFGGAGIQFSGDADAQNPLAAVPFGRIINNTIYGATTPQGTGILVTNNASPTIVNNIVANTATGISIDASSQGLSSPPVLAANIYQNNTTNTNLPNSDLGTNGIALAPTDPLFVNAAANNFYLKAFSSAIDSSLNTLQDRAAMTQVTAPIGIAPSPIVAPTTDINGQLRVADPSERAPGSGLGSNVFIDRGAVERADFTGPSATLLTPADNDVFDQNPAVNFVHDVGLNLSEFEILLSDGIGSGVDNTTVTQDRVTVRRNGVLLTPGIDYAFVYDNNNHIIRLIAASGVWQNGSVYDIALDNGKKFDPQDPSLGPKPGDPGISDLAGNSLQADSPNGFTTFQVILASIQNNPPAVVLPTAQQTIFEHEAIRFAPTLVADTDAPEASTDPDSAAGSDPYLDIPAANGTPNAAGDNDWDVNNPITVFDVDANGGIEQVTLTASVGTLSILQDANTPSASVVQVSGNGTTANPLVLRGPLGDLATDGNGHYIDPGINTALAHLVFRLDDPSNPGAYYFNGTANITIVANDLGNTPPPARITTVNLPITVLPVNDAPIEVVPSPTDNDTVRLSPTEAASATSSTMDFPAASALVGGPGTNSGLTFQVFDSASGAATNFKFANVFEVDIAPSATGSLIAHQTITVTQNGVRKTFEFTTNGQTAAGHVPIAVNASDPAGTIAQDAAKTIGGAAGFNSSSLGSAIGNRLLITSTTSLPASDSLLSLKNTWWEIDVAPNATGQSILHQTFTVTQGTPASGLTTKTFEFAKPWEVDIASNATGQLVAHGTITVTLNGTSKTFEFITSDTGSVTAGNIAISVQDTDGPTQLAAAAATVIDGPNGFNVAGLAQANAAAVVITAPTKVNGTGAGTLLVEQDPQKSNPSNVPVVVRLTDAAAQVAAAAAAAVDGPSGFNASALATVNPAQSNQVLIATLTTITSSDTLLSLFNPVPYLASDSAAQVAQDAVTAINSTLPSQPASVQAGGNRVTLTGTTQFTAAPPKQPANPSSEDTPYVFSQANGNSVIVSDPDVTGTNVNNAALQFNETISLVSGSGTLHVQNTSGITFINGSSNDSATLQFQGTLAGINSALEGLAFDPTNEFVGPVHLTFLANDNGNIGFGPAPTHAPAPVPLSSPLEDVYLAIFGSQDAPVLNPLPMMLTAINEQPTNPPSPPIASTPNTGNTVYSILQTGASPGNTSAMTLIASGAKYGIAITGVQVPTMPAGTPGGTWQYSLDGGTTWQNIVPGPNNGVGLAPPTNLFASPASTGSLATNTTYHYVVTAVDAQGETGASAEATATTGLTQRTINLSWNA
ncbi:MAG TPA: hypothetical protein VJ783_01440, partial [Pirellulales bacterium]|nr:hypothetical protein [Pirellulales bacterium]